MADVDTKGVKEAQAKLAALEDLFDEVESEVNDQVFDYPDIIHSSIKKKGLVGNDNKDQIPLSESFFASRVADQTWRVFSLAPHSKAIQYGARPHTITPDTAQQLAFQVDNPGDYPASLRRGNGWIVTNSVEHPGNIPYDYMSGAESQWKLSLNDGLRRTITREIQKSGFRRRS